MKPVRFERVPVWQGEEPARLPLHMVQAWHPDPPLGRAEPLDDILARIPTDARLVVLSEHPDLRERLAELQERATTSNQLIVGLLGPTRLGDTVRNEMVVVAPGDAPRVYAKLVPSYDDEQLGHMQRGSVVPLLETPHGRIAVLNCHEYTHVDLLAALGDAEVDVLLVLTRNRGARLYGEYALSDAHRLCAYVVVSNVANYGGSLVHAPFRRLENGWLRLGGRVFSGRGPARAELDVTLDIPELRRIREGFREFGEAAFANDATQPVVPTERFLPGGRGWIGALEDVHEEPLPSVVGRPATGRRARIALGALRAAPLSAYLETHYRFSRSPAYPRFRERLLLELDQLQQRLVQAQSPCDFLVFPEVFFPRALLPRLEEFAVRNQTIVITGLEYAPETPGREEVHGANDCLVLAPTPDGGVVRHEYRKLTRSQYDARHRAESGRKLGAPFTLDRGTRLTRFRHPTYGTFAVLICYDLSHAEIVRAVNLHGRDEPAELLFVLAYNPYVEMYRACCMSDAHRGYQYVVLCNVADYGGSGVFGPLRTKGAPQVIFDAGTAEGIFLVDVDLDALENARRRAERNTAPEDFQNRPGVFKERFVRADP